uniref:Histone-lysine N-methyltransferase SETMAR n=1 Tax=Heterorhabditis bacteriophora TaxID=37862 RepID=A0A1I7X1E0_HETBA
MPETDVCITYYSDDYQIDIEINVRDRAMLNDVKMQLRIERAGNGDFDFNDKPRSGWPSLIDGDIVKTIIEQDPFFTTSKIAEKLYSAQQTISKHIILHYDSTRPHARLATSQKIAELGLEILSHPPFFPDLAPSNYYLFLSLQNFLKKKI